MAKKNRAGFEISVSASDEGTVEAVYIRLATRKVSRTVEIDEDILLADFDSRGNLIGIEILAPVKLSRITKLVEEQRRPHFRKFVKQNAPHELVLA